MQQLLEEGGARPVRDILDVGAATGLSSLALLKAFPDAEVTGGSGGRGRHRRGECRALFGVQGLQGSHSPSSVGEVRGRSLA